MKRHPLLRLAPIQFLLLIAVSCTPEATAPLFDSDVESTANHKGDDGDSYAKTKGVIAEIDDEGMRVRVGDDWYWANDDTKVKIDDFDGTPTFDDLQVDDPVHIEHRAVADEDKGYYATEIKVVDDDEDDEVKYAKAEGYVEEVDEDGMRFRIGEDKWFWVDENTQYCDDDDDDNGHLECSFEDVQVGVWVKVKHAMEMEEDKGYYAGQVIVKPNHQFEWAEGYVEEVDADGMRFRIGEDMWFWVDEHTQYCDDGDDDGDEDCQHTCSFEDVQVGVWVKTKYRTFMNEDQGYYAMKVLVKHNKQFEWSEGGVEEVDRDGMRFRIGEDTWFWVDEHTRYCDEDEYDHECWSFDDVQVGVWAKVRYRTFLTEDKGYYAGKVLLKFGHESAEGEVLEIDGDGMRIKVGDLWFWADEHTEIHIDDFEGDPSFGNIETGDNVKIEYRTPAYADKGFYAKKIEVKSS